MNEEEKALLNEAVNLSRENNKILHGMRREARLTKLWIALKWLVIIIVTVWSYFLIQPYLEQLQEAYKSIQEAKDAVTGFQGKVEFDQNTFSDFFKNLSNKN